MKTKLFLAAVVFVANCSIANAQVLGGNAVGGLGGSLGTGGMRDIGAVGHGTASGAFGADLDTRSLRRQTNEEANRASARTRSTLATTRDRARATTNTAGHVSRRTVSAAHDQAVTGASVAQSAAASGAHAALDVGHDAAATASKAKPSIDIDADTTSSATFDVAKSEGALLDDPSASLSGEAQPDGNARIANTGVPVDIAGDASADGGASASKDGAHARGSANGASEIAIGN